MLRICSLIVSLVCSVVLWPGFVPSATAMDIAGTVRVIDGDSLEIAGTRVRLFAVDAPELDQTCDAPGGGIWACGDWAAGQVRAAFGGQRAECTVVDIDQYGRAVARCTAGSADMGARIVAEGWAMAYRRYGLDYDLAEKGAAAAGRGIWSGGAEAPEAYRARMRPTSAAPAAAPGDCVIKGNISGSGRIYHLPGQEDYDRTGINESRGERWFCSEAEAEAAGWRRARR
ncbi:MAG: thermonuclease family protein [Rhodobacteraceae bacterium]|jgi:endonuclease YncB( thermonuclease family)|nr:thermonuclease family protein [Paracoccaceae bacterium]